MLASALAGLKRANSSKSISLTLPVLPIGLVTAGLNIVNACHSAGFHPDTINVMAMDYGSYYDNGGNMLLSAQQAAQATRTQTGDMIGVTPMIGVNDTSTEIFTISNASSFVAWAKGQSYINRLAFWSLSRDNGGCPGLLPKSEIDAVAVGTSYAEVRAKLGAPSRGDPGLATSVAESRPSATRFQVGCLAGALS